MAAYNRRAYANGYRVGMKPGLNSLESADDRNAPEEWYDGYYDAAAGRPRGHLITCTDRDLHETCPWETR